MWAREKLKPNTRSMLVNKANRPQILIKDVVTLISKLIYSKCQATFRHQPISFSRCRIQRRQREIMISMRNKTTINMTRKNSSAMLVAVIIEILTCHANESWTYFLENPFLKQLPLFFLTEDLIGASFFGVSRRHWPIPIGWATADTHSSALKTAYGEADGVIYL